MGVVFVITAIIMYPIIVPFLFADSTKKRAFKLFVFWSWLFRVLTFYFVRIEGKENRPDEACIIIANHSSYLDIFLLYSILPNQPFLFLGKSEILKYPLLKTYFKRLNIPVFRGNRVKSAKAIVQALSETKNGWSIAIFPEGGIPEIDFPDMAHFKAGAFQIAKNSGLPILPMTYRNHFKLFSDPSFILGPARPGVSKVKVHRMITVEEINLMSIEELRTSCRDQMLNDLMEFYNR